MSDDDFDGLVFKDLDAGYTQQPPATLAEISALLASFERFKKRLVVPTARVAEFEAAVLAAGLAHAVTVIGHAWLEPDQAYLMASEAELEADMQTVIQKGIREQAAAETARMRAHLAWATEERMRQQVAPPPWSPPRGISGI
jgi:hypothetical protein